MFKSGNSRKSEPEIIDIEKKDGFLDELNLPPHVVKFIRANARFIQVAALVLVVLVLAWSYYDYHTQTKQNKAALALSTAVNKKDNVARLESLSKVEKEYSGTAAALWSRIEEGHLASKEGRYDDALAKYREVYDDLSGDNPLRPLVLYSMSLAQENGGKLDKALEDYRKLADFEGFKSMALAAEGRIYELQGDQANALKVYRQVAEDKKLSPESRSLIEEKINSLQTKVPAVTG